MQSKLALGTAAWCLMAGLTFAQTTDPATDPTADPMVPGTATDPAVPGATAELTVPEGYTPYATPLTAEELLETTIYDSTGESIGEIHDLVFVSAEAGAMVPDAGTMPDATGTGLPGDGTTANDPAATVPTTPGTPDSDEMITHVVLDIGGFLGMGEHRVALPISDLEIFRAEDDDLRIYLPWTRDQLNAMPVYDENNPETLGRPTMSR